MQDFDGLDVPEILGFPGLGGKLPQPWLDLIAERRAKAGDAARSAELEMTAKAWIMFGTLRAQQLIAEDAKRTAQAQLAAAKEQADSAKTHARHLTLATWVLAAATVALVVVTLRG